MKWSLRLGRFLGIDVFLHITFLLFVGLVWYMTRASGLGTVGFMLAMFTCVVLHEYGHALTARRFGISTRDITLLPMGGLARLERMPSEPWQELLVAIAGPAVNIVIAAVLWIVCLALGLDPFHKVDHVVEGRSNFFATLLWWNMAMVAFNMLPAFPMDGGRVLRSLLAMKLPYNKATQIAATIGKVMALIFAWYAIFRVGNPILILVAFFVWSGATYEAEEAEHRTMLHGVKVRDAMISDFRRVSPDDDIRTVAQLILQGWQADFPVVMDDRVVGMVTRRDVADALSRGSGVTVAQVMREVVHECSADEPLEGVLDRIREFDLPMMPVTADGGIIGLVTPENTGEFVVFRRAIAARMT
jgi:Zn-dependent protease/CBS domain-containing protein